MTKVVHLLLSITASATLFGCQDLLPSQSSDSKVSPSTGTSSEISECSTEPISIAESCVGPIVNQTPSAAFDKANIQSMFPDLAIAETIRPRAGRELPVLELSKDDMPWLEIYPISAYPSSYIFEIYITSKAVINPLGHEIGDSFESVYQGNPTTGLCSMSDIHPNSVLCLAPESRRIRYLFSGEGDNTEGTFPDDGVLQQWTIERINWRPDMS